MIMENFSVVRARERSAWLWAPTVDALVRSRRVLGLTVIAMGSLPAMLTASAFIGLGHSLAADAGESECARMLRGAPERVRLLEAVQSCQRADAGCAYVEPTGYGVLTLICPQVVQVVFADRLSSLRLRDGVPSGECTSGSWQFGSGLPGCYPPQWSVAP